MFSAEIPLSGKQAGRIKIVGRFLYAIFRLADGFSISLNLILCTPARQWHAVTAGSGTAVLQGPPCP